MNIEKRITEIIEGIRAEYNNKYECVEFDDESKANAIEQLTKLFVFREKPEPEDEIFKPVFLVNKKDGVMVLAVEPSEERAYKQMGHSHNLKIVYLGQHEIKSILEIQGLL